MRKVLKSGAISVSEDVLQIRDVSPKVISISDSDGERTIVQEQSDTQIADISAKAELILQKAEEQADRIIRDAAERAEQDRTAILQQGRLEAEQIRAQAVEDGRSEGARMQLGAIRSCIETIELTISRLEGEQAGFIAEYEQNLKWLALEIASKVLNQKLEQDDAILTELVRGAVNTAKGSDWITVQISDSMPALLDSLTDALHVAESGKIEIHDVPAPPGTCIVETAAGIVDASVYVQLENLKEYFKNE